MEFKAYTQYRSFFTKKENIKPPQEGNIKEEGVTANGDPFNKTTPIKRKHEDVSEVENDSPVMNQKKRRRAMLDSDDDDDGPKDTAVTMETEPTVGVPSSDPSPYKEIIQSPLQMMSPHVPPETPPKRSTGAFNMASYIIYIYILVL